MKCFVLDTSVFTNPDVFAQFADDAVEAIEAFLELAGRVHARASFYMPLSVYDELRQMKDLDRLGAAYESVVHIRSPRKFNIMIPGELLYELIDEVRARIDRGLRIAEEHAKMGRDRAGAQDVGAVINKLRDRYREALRRGILDSREDVDVLLLAYELDGTLVSADDGMRKWADKIGVKIIQPRHLRHIMTSLTPTGNGTNPP